MVQRRSRCWYFWCSNLRRNKQRIPTNNRSRRTTMGKWSNRRRLIRGWNIRSKRRIRHTNIYNTRWFSNRYQLWFWCSNRRTNRRSRWNNQRHKQRKRQRSTKRTSKRMVPRRRLRRQRNHRCRYRTIFHMGTSNRCKLRKRNNNRQRRTWKTPRRTRRQHTKRTICIRGLVLTRHHKIYTKRNIVYTIYIQDNLNSWYWGSWFPGSNWFKNTEGLGESENEAAKIRLANYVYQYWI